jgi:hypothetical protein
MTTLSAEAVDFARNHIIHYWDSDFFPKLFEFQCLWAYWDEVREYLTTTDIEDIEVTIPRLMAVPKANGGFRVVHQLDPLNAIVYTAMAYMVAESVELARLPLAEKAACSYRINLDHRAGKFFGEGNGYKDFVDQSRILCARYSHVLETDITDFYNQIYLHRLQNALSVAENSLTDLSRDIETFLIRLNDKVSHGVPVGPVASIIMSEAVLIDVDSFLVDKGYQFTRYVDDYRIFGESKVELQKLLNELTIYLHVNHRLVLSGSKTKFYSSEEFVERILDEPIEIERREIHQALEHIEAISGYPFADDDASDMPPNVVERTNVLRSLMSRVCDMDKLDLGLARHVLRRCRRYKLRAIIPQLLDNFDFFAPVITDVVLYLSAVTNISFLERYGDQLISICVSSEVAQIDFVRYWLTHYVVRNYILATDIRFKRFVLSNPYIEHQAQLAFITRRVAWVREWRSRMNTLGDWDRRQLLRSTIVLARGERRPLYERIEGNTQTKLDQWVLRWVKSH